MATIKLHAFERNINKKTLKVPVYIRLIHEKKPMYIRLNIDVDSQHFDFKTCQCTKKHEQYLDKNTKLTKKRLLAEDAIRVLEDRHYSSQALREHIEFKLNRKHGGSTTLMDVANPLIENLKKIKQSGWAGVIDNCCKWFNDWNGGDKPLISITYEVLNNYKIWLLTVSRKGNGIEPSTVISYFGALRAVFKEAKRLKLFPNDPDLDPFAVDGLIPPINPEGKPHNLSIDVVSKYEKVQPTLTGTARRTCDFVLLQFYFRGVDFIELAMARKAHVVDGYWIFKRYKNRTGKKGLTRPTVKVKITDKAYLILAQYNHPDLLIPVLDGFPVFPNGMIDIESNRKLYNTRYSHYLRDLKKIEKLTGIHISGKSMRYLWISMAEEEEEISLQTIKVGVGHSDREVNNRYKNNPKLKDKLQQRVDNANDLIQSKVNSIENL